MTIQARPYATLEDLAAMHAVLSAGAAARTNAFYVHPGDLSWWLFYTTDEAPLCDRIWIWEDEGEVIGWTLFSVDEGFVDLFVKPAWLDHEAYAEMQARSVVDMERRVKAAGGKRVAVMWIDEADRARQALLLAQGFTRAAGDRFVCFEQSLVGPLRVEPLPEGSELLEVSTEVDLEARARPQAAAFKSRLPWDRYLDRYRRFRRSPVYAGAHDTGLVLADGTFAAVTIWWVDSINKIGHFEPVATDPALQRRGYGKALLRGCLERMRAMGLLAATVCTGAESADNIAFYRACGFEIAARVVCYERILEP